MESLCSKSTLITRLRSSIDPVSWTTISPRIIRLASLSTVKYIVNPRPCFLILHKRSTGRCQPRKPSILVTRETEMTRTKRMIVCRSSCSSNGEIVASSMSSLELQDTRQHTATDHVLHTISRHGSPASGKISHLKDPLVSVGLCTRVQVVNLPFVRTHPPPSPKISAATDKIGHDQSTKQRCPPKSEVGDMSSPL